MPRVPFNAERILAHFMAKESAEALAEDLEERFAQICSQSGRMPALLWFGWALIISLPPLIIPALARTFTEEPVLIVIDESLLASFFMSWLALELALMPITQITRSRRRNLLNPFDKLTLAHHRLSTSEMAEIVGMWKLRNQLVHRRPGYAPPLASLTIERLHELIKRLRESGTGPLNPT
jgi:hypothetical protein